MKSIQLFLALFALTFAVSCQKDKQGPQSIAASPHTSQGPSDGGGGDTCNGKMIESFKIDITQLSEFRTFVQPILEKIAISSESPFQLLPAMKSWYLIDCKLQDLPKERKGLYLETYQTAIHTGGEVFIDAKSYNNMVPEEKAKLLLHEMVMGYYLLKYLSLEQICKVSQCTDDVIKISPWKMFRAQSYRPLNAADHEKIRKVTAWLWEQKNIVRSEFFVLLKNNEFDRRFLLQPDAYSENEKETQVEMNVETLVRMFKKYQWNNSLPQHCGFDARTNESTSLCQTTIEGGIRDVKLAENFSYKHLYVKVQIIRDSDKKKWEQEFLYALPENHKIPLSQIKLAHVANTAPFAMLAQWPGSNHVEVREGHRSQMLTLMLNLTDPQSPEIYQMLFTTRVWYAFEDVVVERDGEKNKETYGYSVLVPEESEQLFIEKELPFPINNPLTEKNLIRSTPLKGL